MAVKISSGTYDSTNATKQTFSGASGENRFYGLNTIDWVTFENASGVVDASFFVPNITTGDVFVLKGVNAETVLAHIIGNSVVLTFGSQIFTFGAIAGGESFTVKFATSDGTISGKDLTIHRTDDNSGLAIEATYLGNPTMPLTETPVNVAYVVPVIQLAEDTGVSSSDGITSNPLLSITNLVSDSTKVEYSTNGTDWINLPKTTSTLASFLLPVTDSQTVTYNAGTIQVRQTYSVNGIQKIATGSNSAITIDRAKPIAAIPDSVIATDTDSSSSYTTGDKIRMTFNEAVSLSSDILTGILSSHTLGTSATIHAVNAVNGYATQFDITLGTSPTISPTDVLTIGANKATDKAGNTSDAVTFTVPTLPDITKPFMQSAVVPSDGASIVITYSENLKNSLVTASDFLITLADNSTVTGTNAAISDATVTLTLSKKIGTGELSISYTDGTSHSIQDLSSNAATSQSLMSSSITNNSTADVTVPTLVSATVNGASIVLTYNEPLDGTKKPSTEDFSVAINGGAGVHPASLVVDGTGKKVTLTLALANTVSYGQSVLLNYVDVEGDSLNAIQDISGNDAVSLTNQIVTNLTPIIDFTAPVISDARITGSSLVLTLTELNSLSGTPLSTDFKVYKIGVANALTYSSTSPITYNTTAKTVTLTLGSAVVGTDAITIDYTRPPSSTSQRINDIANNSLAGFSGRTVSNATSHTLTSAITSANFVERAIDDGRYIALKGTGFSQLLDIGKGEIASASTDVIGHLDLSKIVWNTVSTDNSTSQALSNSATSVPHVYLVSDTEMRVVLSDILWNSLTSSSNLLSAVDGAQDNVVITSEFLKDFAGNTSLDTLTATEGTFTLDEYHKSVSGTQAAPDAPTIYSSNIFLSGSGYFSGTNIKTNGGITVDGLASGQTLELSNLASLANGGTLTNANNTGEVIVRLGNVDGVVAPATTGVSSTSTGTTTVIFSNNNSTIYQFFTLGDGIDKFFLASTSALPQISGGTFDVTKDKILLDVHVFKGFSQATTGTITSPTAITSDQFEIASSASANSGNIRLFFNDGSLYYDSDGSGGGAAPVKILEIGTPSGALTDANFGLVANS